MSKQQDELREKILNIAYMPPDAGRDSPLQLLATADIVKLINSGVRAALDKVKSQAVENINGVKVVGVHAIEEVRKDYE